MSSIFLISFFFWFTIIAAILVGLGINFAALGKLECICCSQCPDYLEKQTQAKTLIVIYLTLSIFILLMYIIWLILTKMKKMTGSIAAQITGIIFFIIVLALSCLTFKDVNIGIHSLTKGNKYYFKQAKFIMISTIVLFMIILVTTIAVFTALGCNDKWYFKKSIESGLLKLPEPI